MDTWTDEQFVCWLAGFFDGEGCIYLNPTFSKCSEVSVAGTDENAIRSIHKRLGYGIITKVTYGNEKWKAKFHWRIRQFRDVEKFLSLIRPFLIIKLEKADVALERCRTVRIEKSNCADRYEEIKAMLATGKTGREVAKHFKVSETLVSVVKTGKRSVTYCPQKEISYTRMAKERTLSKHTAPFMPTRTELA